MRLTLPTPDIDIGTDTFESEKQLDWLERKAFGERLSRLVEAIDDPTVIALDGSWDSGKSHFLKLWAGAHVHQFNGTAKVIYFDAFKEDFLDDPLISLVAALAPAKEDESRFGKAATKLKHLALPLAKGAARVGLAVASYGATAAAEGVWEAVTKATSGELEKGVEAIDTLWARETTKRAAMEAFVATLREATEPETEGAPLNKLVIIVDELDRCRPDYALSLLETIKHFFAVDGVHFVLGVNLSELENSVKARYGAGCDARTYLQKFVTLVVHLPNDKAMHGHAGTTLEYAKKLAEAYGFPQNHAKSFKTWIEARDLKTPVSLRDIDRCARRVALVIPTVADKEEAFQEACMALCIVDAISPETGRQLRRQEFQAAQLSQFFRFDSQRQAAGSWHQSLLSRLQNAEPHRDDDWSLRHYCRDTLRLIYQEHMDAWERLSG